MTATAGIDLNLKLDHDRADCSLPHE